MFKRAYLSVTRRKSKSILLFIILFVVANLIITTIAIKNATNESTEFAKESIGSEVTLSADMSSVRGNREDRTEESQNEVEKTQIEMPSITVKDVLSIADSKYISGYSYGFTTYANVKDLETVESEMEKMGNFEVDGSKVSGDFGGRGKMPNFTMNMGDIRQNLVSGDVTLEATNSFESLSSVKNGTLEITNGDAANLEDENTVIVSYDFAELNSLTVGSVISLSHTETEEEIELTVVAIYDSAEDSTNDMRNMIMNSSNTMYVNLATGESFMTEESYNEGEYALSSAVYYLTDPENYDAFVAEAESKVGLEERNLKLSIDESTYQRMVGSIESIGNFANIILIVVIFASVLLVTLIINSQVKERNYEVGVLLSLGENKRRIVGQIAIELVAIATTAFIISTFTGTLISNVIGDNLTTTQTALKEEQSMNMPGGGRGGMMDRDNMQTKTETLDVDVSVGVTECAVLFGVGYLISILAMILPAVNIFRYDPKTILSRRE